MADAWSFGGLHANRLASKGSRDYPEGVGDYYEEGRQGGRCLELRSFTGMPLGVAMPGDEHTLAISVNRG